MMTGKERMHFEKQRDIDFANGNPATLRFESMAAKGDPIENLLHDVAVAEGSLVIRGSLGVLRTATGVRPYQSPIGAGEILERLGIDAPEPIPEGWTGERRIARPGAWFHICATRVSGEIQIRLSNLRTAIPSCEEIGLDPTILGPAPGTCGDTGLLLWSGVPGGPRSSALAAWLTCASRCATASSEGPTVWIEDDPVFAWEGLGDPAVYGGHPSRVGIRSVLEWSPQRVVIDSVRTPRAARLALDLAEAGIATVAVIAGLMQAEAVGRLEMLLERDGLPRSGSASRIVLGFWIGVLPLGGTGLVATQIETIGGERPHRTYREEIARLEQCGRISREVAERIVGDLADLAA